MEIMESKGEASDDKLLCSQATIFKILIDFCCLKLFSSQFFTLFYFNFNFLDRASGCPQTHRCELRLKVCASTFGLRSTFYSEEWFMPNFIAGQSAEVRVDAQPSVVIWVGRRVTQKMCVGVDKIKIHYIQI